jgi:hypothetical protein
MKCSYLIEPGTSVMVSEGGTVFKPRTLKNQLQFDHPTVTSDNEFTFSKVNLLIRVPRADVTFCEWDSIEGRHNRHL